jgi:hypothetical protein
MPRIECDGGFLWKHYVPRRNDKILLLLLYAVYVQHEVSTGINWLMMCPVAELHKNGIKCNNFVNLVLVYSIPLCIQNAD